jgi:diguanylate cyclase (GGDEF)-like protein/PAS domain S-box-containing protein
LTREAELLEWLPDGLLVVDEAGSIVYANRQAERLTGYRRSELLGMRIELLLPVRLRTTHREHRRDYNSHPRRRPMGTADHEFLLRRKDGTQLAADIALGPIGRPGGRQTAAAIRDASERTKLEADLKRRALHDPLTDLPNRNLFFDRLKQAMLANRRDRRSVALVMLDLDGFKTINDSLGHVAGDQILRDLAVALQAGLRSTDTVARIGGDEFAWILPSMAGPQATIRRVRSLLRSVTRTYAFDGKPVQIGVSAGLALFPDDGRNADALMRHADLALYTAKRQGGGLAFIRSHGRNSRARAAKIERSRA